MNVPRPAIRSERSVRAVFVAFLALGLTSFGGPIAHLGYFRHEFVSRRRWLGEADYADLVALCQFLPGPTSSQVGFAIGLRRAGPFGAIAAFVGFTLPSALLMFAFAAGAARFDTALGTAVLHGLKLAAVAVVADAVLGMARALTPDLPRAGIALASASIVLLVPVASAQILAIAAGALLYRLVGTLAPHPEPAVPAPSGARRSGYVALALFVLLLAAPTLLAEVHLPGLSLFEAFFRSGALVFGGGHVMLPLLEAELVATRWLDAETFLAGYGMAQAMPGPLFSVATFLGALATPAPGPAAGALIALAGIFLPGFLLLLAVLPAWRRLRTSPSARSALAGANAAVVGLLAATLLGFLTSGAIGSVGDALIAALAFAALHLGKVPPLPVVAGAAVGAAALALAA